MTHRPISFDPKPFVPEEPFVPVMVAYRADSVFACHLYGELFPAVAIPVSLYIDNARALASIISGGKYGPEMVERIAREFDTEPSYIAVIPAVSDLVVMATLVSRVGTMALFEPAGCNLMASNPRRNKKDRMDHDLMMFFPLDDVEGKKRAVRIVETQSGRNGVSPVIMESLRSTMLAMIDHPTVTVKVKTSFPGSKQFDG